MDVYILTAMALFQVGWFFVNLSLLFNQRRWVKKRDAYYMAQFSSSSNKAVIDLVNETKKVLVDIKNNINK